MTCTKNWTTDPGLRLAGATLFAAAILAACQADEPVADAPVGAEEIVVLPFDSFEMNEAFERFLDEQGAGEGKWREDDGMLVCEGYLTRYESQDYCASEIPPDWEPFEYDGQVYYIQPLGGSNTAR